MTYHVLARKWRPQNFSDLVGQSHVVKALTFALSQDQVHHAYLFTGTRGVGKTSIARIFAKSLNCENNGVSANPCGECESCREIKDGKFVDLIEVDAASRTGVEETRELIESVSYRPTKGRYKVYLIDEVHMFSKSSFNALLKTLEEPPPHVKFILATTDPEKLPITILSRCLQFNLKSLTQSQIQQHLANICKSESIDYDKDALSLLANAGDGSMRDTLSMTDQAIAYGQGHLNLAAVTEILGTIQPTDIESILFAIATNNPAQLSRSLHRLDDYEIDARAFLIEIMRRLQKMAWAKEGIVDHLSPTLLSTVEDLPKPLIHLWYDIAEKALPNLALSGDPRKAVEMTLLRMIAFIPDDWVARHRTTFELPQQPVETSNTEKVAPKTTDANHSASNTPIAAKSDQSVAARPFDDKPINTLAANTETTPPSEDNEVNKRKENQPANFATQLKSTPVAASDSLEAAEDNFSGQTQTDNNKTNESAGKEKIEPLAAKVEESTTSQSAWHLDSQPSQEAPPSMEEINNLMQRGSDIKQPQNTPSEKQVEAKPTATDSELAAKDVQSIKTELKNTNAATNSDNFDWFEVVEQLSLSDFTQHFANQGLLRLVEDDNRLQAILDLSPRHEVLITEESLAEMQLALQKHFKTPINFSINLTDIFEQTPAEKKQLQHQKERASLIQQFTENPTTQRIINELGGQVIEKTIKAINSSPKTN